LRVTPEECVVGGLADGRDLHADVMSSSGSRNDLLKLIQESADKTATDGTPTAKYDESKPSHLQPQLEALRAPLLAACWAEAGFGAKRPRVSQERWPHEIECTYIDCVGDVCNQRKLWVKLFGGGHLSTMPASLFMKLLTQPLSLACLAGMITLATSCFVESEVSTVLLMPVGGRDMGFIVLAAAVAAHLAESAYCFYVLTTALKQPLGATLAYCFLVLLVGWPVTRRVIQLKRAAAPSKTA